MIFNESGGMSLNFKVLSGTSAPASPKENTIWVNMASAITGWYFGSDEPDVREEGTLWITTGVSSNVAFNALKKNGLKVYPISAKHYRSGVWVEKPAKSYQGGAWVDWWSGQLYEYGKQYEPQTGGWTTEGYLYEKWAPLATFNSSNMYIYFEMGAGVGGVGTRKKINLSGYSTLKAIVTPTSNTLYVCALANKSDDMASTYIARKSVSAGSQQTVTLDIAAVSEAYIGFATMGNATIHAVWLE